MLQIATGVPKELYLKGLQRSSKTMCFIKWLEHCIILGNAEKAKTVREVNAAAAIFSTELSTDLVDDLGTVRFRAYLTFV